MNYNPYDDELFKRALIKTEKKVKEETAMVNVGLRIPMKSGYWSKKPGEKAVFVSPPAKQLARKGPSKSRHRIQGKPASM